VVITEENILTIIYFYIRWILVSRHICIRHNPVTDSCLIKNKLLFIILMFQNVKNFMLVYQLGYNSLR
jgi:hypothetical protein